MKLLDLLNEVEKTEEPVKEVAPVQEAESTGESSVCFSSFSKHSIRNSYSILVRITFFTSR